MLTTNVTDVLEKLCQVDKCGHKQTWGNDVQNWHWSQMVLDCKNSISKFNSSGLLSCKLKFHIHEKVNDVTEWLSQTTDM